MFGGPGSWFKTDLERVMGSHERPLFISVKNTPHSEAEGFRCFS